MQNFEFAAYLSPETVSGFTVSLERGSQIFQKHKRKQIDIYFPGFNQNL